MINDWEAPKQMCRRMMERNSADAVFWRNVLMSWGWGWGCHKKTWKSVRSYQNASKPATTFHSKVFTSLALTRCRSHLLPFALPPSHTLTNVFYIYTHSHTHPHTLTHTPTHTHTHTPTHTHTHTRHVTTHPQTCCLTLFLSRLVTVSVCNLSFSLYATSHRHFLSLLFLVLLSHSIKPLTNQRILFPCRFPYFEGLPFLILLLTSPI